MVDPIELHVLVQTSHPAILVVAHLYGGELLVVKNNRKLKADLLTGENVGRAGHHHSLPIGNKSKRLTRSREERWNEVKKKRKSEKENKEIGQES